MKIFALADVHLCLGVPEKTMEIFGEPWIGYVEKIREQWEGLVSSDDWVLLPGDISWGMTLEEAKADFDFLGELPGNKLMIRGNHDYWSSATTNKLKKVLPANLWYLKGGIFRVPGTRIDIVGTRLWEDLSVKVSEDLFPKGGKVRKRKSEEDLRKDRKIFEREIGRLKQGLELIPDDNEKVIVMTHYPTISFDGTFGEVSCLLEDYGVSISVFGHLHGLMRPFPRSFEGCSIEYRLVSADSVGFIPQELLGV